MLDADGNMILVDDKNEERRIHAKIAAKNSKSWKPPS